MRPDAVATPWVSSPGSPPSLKLRRACVFVAASKPKAKTGLDDPARRDDNG
ncbi:MULTISPECIES: hypothetical protein [unclassified Bradyrhizobium]|uniref:hypothetical protein n=1 Tax=unclassified Bradyrhizobium TaxID=2631580 RepID=UPI0024E0EFA3|nr:MULTISPECIES: hypothetical protein [unclassified Bradyrhizobium]